MQTEEPQTCVSGTAGTHRNPCQSAPGSRAPTALSLETGAGRVSISGFAVTLRGPQHFETALDKQHYLEALREGYRLGMLEIDERQIAESLLCVALSTQELMKTPPLRRKSRIQNLAAPEQASDPSLTEMSGRKQTRHRESGMELLPAEVCVQRRYRGLLKPGNRRWNIRSE